MEVHHHPNSQKHNKTWTHYLLEFFMLFLAVFLGFVAENQREHIVEHRREKKFIQSLALDLREDTAEISRSIELAAKTKFWQDKIIEYVVLNPPRDYLTSYFLDTLSLFALPRLSVVFNEVTALQLKNAGNLRLIRKQEVSRKISMYWKEQENVNINIDRYLIYRNRGREFEEQLLEIFNVNLPQFGIIAGPIDKFKVLTNEPAKWTQYMNIISHCRVTVQQLKISLEKLLEIAKQLLLLLEKEYH